MHASRVTRVLILSTSAFVLAACTLPFGGGDDDVPDQELTPTLITPAVLPPTETPTPEPTATPELTPTPEVTATPEPTATPEGPASHQVAKGEWVYEIARVYGVNPKDIIAANPNIQSNPDLIFPNQQLALPAQQPAAADGEAPTPTPTPVAGPTVGAPSLPLVERSVYEGLLAESLPPLDGSSCSTDTAARFESAWGQEHIAPRLGCAEEAAISISGTWLEFGPGSRIIWLRELGEFHAITGDGFGQRWVFADNSGLADAAPQVRPDGASFAYTPTQGRFAWLLGEHPEMTSIFAPAFGDENVIVGEYQKFDNGAMLFDGALRFVFFDDSGPWWVLAE